ncbi:major facilitator superfamily transporter [Xylaria sp. CBS 124048]|nr:major facilitator superfamily transporter [Xylaria sp. CBS 124048]
MSTQSSAFVSEEEGDENHEARENTSVTKDHQTQDPRQKAEAGLKDDGQVPTSIRQQEEYTVYNEFEKRLIVWTAAVDAIFSPLSSQIYYPALNQLSLDIGVSVTEINLTITTYMIVQAIAPMFVGSLADSAGRRPAYIICFVTYIAACIGCALAPSYGALLALRALQSAGSSATMSLCQAVVSDVITSAERGSYVGITALPIILAPSIGPVIGGLISQFLGWRWIFWFLSIFAGVALVLYVLFMPETCRLLVGDGSIRPPMIYRTPWQVFQDARRMKKEAAQSDENTNNGEPLKSPRIQRPDLTRTVLILFEKEIFLLLMYASLLYAAFYAIFAAIPAQFSKIYGFQGLKIGLVYVPTGIGSIVTIWGVGKLADWNYKRHCHKLGVPYDRNRQNDDMSKFPIEQARLELGVPFLALFIAVLIAFGWTLEFKAPLAVEIVLLFLVGCTVPAFSNLLNALIVDLNPGATGAATAANNLTRGLVGAAASAFINPLITAVGSGWAFTIIAFSFVVFFPAPYLLMKNGMRWRAEKARREEMRRRQRA